MKKIRSALLAHQTSSPEKMAVFFKTGKGQYAEHDEFLGVTTPNLRKIAQIFSDLPITKIQKLLSSEINEERLLALFILISRYQKADLIGKEELFQFYLQNLDYVNNWNLVDSSAHLIIGCHVFDKNRDILLSYQFTINLAR